MRIKPAGSFILVRPEKRKRRYGSLILGDQALGVEKVSEGTGHIVSIADELWPKSISTEKPVQPLFSEGDRILFRAFLADAHVVEHCGEELSLIHFEDILAVVGEDTDVGALSLKYAGKEKSDQSVGH